MKLGEGAYGRVYRGAINRNGRKFVAYKEINTAKNTLGMAEFEFKVAQKLKAFKVPQMYLYKRCRDLDILYLEYFNGKELNDWWNSQISLKAAKSVLLQVIHTLYMINKSIPGFRHHDLHGGNVIINQVPEKNFTVNVLGKTYTISNGGVEAVIIDFGLAHMPGMINYSINRGQHEDVGISRSSHNLYDLHFFLSAVFAKVERKKTATDVAVYNFIKELIPNDDYFAETSKVTKEHRIRLGLTKNHNLNLPSFTKFLTHSFFAKQNNGFVTGLVKASKAWRPRKDSFKTPKKTRFDTPRPSMRKTPTIIPRSVKKNTTPVRRPQTVVKTTRKQSTSRPKTA
jgi:tRNA A-37 threonylcarbamoyl transferase component Bud32